MKNPRVSVTLNEIDAEMLHMLCEKNGVSLSSMVSRMVMEWLEEYEDAQLYIRAQKAKDDWIKQGKPTISHEELWKNLDT